ncbi:MAG TPA: GntR family transcriptional regulator [Ktedonobacterales bacterium]|nr:GntR family transcriptional regulator [Ktedonobacterales bacterium]
MMGQRRQGPPAYQQLATDLRVALEQGRFGTQGRMPTEAELGQIYGVSRQTVRRAFQDLVAEGLVQRAPKRGTFATGLSQRGQYLRSVGTIEELMAWTGTEMEVVRPIARQLAPEAAARLDLPSDEVAVLVVRRLYEAVPFVLTQIYLPPDVGDRIAAAGVLADRGQGTVIGLLEDFISHPIAGASQSISALSASEEIAAEIDCQPGDPVLYVERLYHDTTGQPQELAISHYNPARYAYRVELRRRLG